MPNGVQAGRRVIVTCQCGKNCTKCASILNGSLSKFSLSLSSHKCKACRAEHDVEVKTARDLDLANVAPEVECVVISRVIPKVVKP